LKDREGADRETIYSIWRGGKILVILFPLPRIYGFLNPFQPSKNTFVILNLFKNLIFQTKKVKFPPMIVLHVDEIF